MGEEQFGKKLMNFFLQILSFFLKILSKNFTKKNNILLFIGNDKSYNSNSRYLFEYLSNKKKLKCYWVSFTRKADDHIKNKKLKTLYYYNPFNWLIIIRARFVFGIGLSRPILHGMLAHNCICINLWHGFGPRSTNGAHNYPKKKILYKIKEWDYFASPTKFIKKKVWKNQFNIDEKKIINFKITPSSKWYSTDINFYKKIKNLKKKYKLLMYAPTWRQSYKRNFPLFEYLFKDIDYLDNYLSKNRIKLIISSHKKYESFFQNDTFRNVKNIIKVPVDERIDINYVVKNIDYLITDYSSIATDALILKKPVYYFLNDYDYYRKNIGFLEDFKRHLPGIEMKNTNDFYKYFSIKNKSLNKNSKKIQMNIKNYLAKYSGNNKRELKDLLKILYDRI